MRLIDADNLIEVLHKSLEGDCDLKKDYELLGIDDFIDNQAIIYDIEHKCECKDCTGCTQWKCDTANVIQEYKENLVKQLEIVKQKHKIEMQKEENETDFYSNYIVSEEHGYIMGLQEVIEMVKGGENNVNITNYEKMV
ncbi:hypothetical protein N5B56_01405 [Eubacterium sp. LFL-14]|uniref:Uncharacterized protein n=1 Tax=Eubacterium album TaxID=2978477 RepID=A0ABT2LZG9_9FIRM|nr:hypothetical protein [Eubacterium sp. LFL-14]MCT7397742.1 hypothetical protein [Eubacterium sp. LFL-14]